MSDWRTFANAAKIDLVVALTSSDKDAVAHLYDALMNMKIALDEIELAGIEVKHDPAL
jgi:hypothetical protein